MKTENFPWVFAVGTESPAKNAYLREVLDELGVGAVLRPFPVSSGVSDQPISSEETLAGAENRARLALEAVPEAQYGIGIEVGYDSLPEGSYTILCWTVIVDRDGTLVKACSNPFVLPDFHQSVLKDGRYLGDHVRDYFAVASDPVTQYVAEALRGRKPFFTESVRYALIYTLHSDYYWCPYGILD